MSVLTVCHSPYAYPDLDQLKSTQMIAHRSFVLVVMSWRAWHSLVDVYGIAPAKLAFIPHPIDRPLFSSPLTTLLSHSAQSHVRLLIQKYRHSQDSNCSNPVPFYSWDDRFHSKLYSIYSTGFSNLTTNAPCHLSLYCKNTNVILTNGLLSKAKGIQRIINSLPLVIARYPNTLFVIVGRRYVSVSVNSLVFIIQFVFLFR